MKIYAIIVTYNGLKWIDKCFQSLQKSRTPVQTIVIDNGSNDGTLEKLRKEYQEVKIIETGENLGFGRANNIGLKMALKDKVDYVFLLNQDAWIKPDTISNLIKAHKKHPEKYGILAPVQLNGSGKNFQLFFSQCISEVGCPNFMSDIYFNRPMQEVYEIRFTNAASWLIPYNILKTIGGFDPLFDLYKEDRDYVNRLNYHGYKMGIVTDSVFFHDHSVDHSSNYKNDDTWKLVCAIHDLKKVQKTRFRSWLNILIEFLFFFIYDLIFKQSIFRQRSKILLFLLRNYKKIKKHKFASRKKGNTFLQ